MHKFVDNEGGTGTIKSVALQECRGPSMDSRIEDFLVEEKDWENKFNINGTLYFDNSTNCVRKLTTTIP